MNLKTLHIMKKISVATLFIVYILLFMVSGCVRPDLDIISEINDNHLVTRSGAQDKFYYGFDEKIYLTEVSNKFVLRLEREYHSEIQRYLQENDRSRLVVLNDLYNVFTLTTAENSNVKALMVDLKKQPGVKSVHPVYKLADCISPEIGLIDEIIMRFKDHVSQQEIDEMHKKFPIEIKEITDYWQILTVPADADLLEIANAYQESGLVIYSCPNFLSKVERCQTLPSDPYFQYQYYLRNIGQPILNGYSGSNNSYAPGTTYKYYVTGTAGADIRVVDAWNITKGSSDIVVAVIDDGVIDNHPDLPGSRQVRLPGSRVLYTRCNFRSKL